MEVTAAYPDAPDRRLRKRYIAALLTVALFASLFAVIVQYRMYEQEMDSRVINIAGRQRMLSQKLAKIALTIKGLDEGDDAKPHQGAMREALEMWSRSHRGLKQGNSEMGLPATNNKEIIEQFKSIEQSYQTMYGACLKIIDLTEIDKNVSLILSTEAVFLKGMNKIVFSFDADSRSKVLILKRTEWILTSVILVVLIIVAFVVFEPAVRLIRRQFEKLSSVASERKKLIDELQEALSTVKQLKGLLPICASCKSIRDDEGYWNRIESFIEKHSDAQFSHSICPDCVKQLYPKLKIR